MSESDNVTELLDGNVEEIVAKLPELTDEQLTALHDAETAGKTRETLIDAIDAERTRRADDAADGDSDPNDRVAELAELSVRDLTGLIANLNDDELNLLAAAESAGKNRASVLKAIDAERNKRADAGKEPPRKPPAWKEPDYTGPLTGEQALWRNKHLAQK